MMRTLRAAAFGLAEGVRLYFGVARGTTSDSRELRLQARPVGAGLVRDAQGGRV